MFLENERNGVQITDKMSKQLDDISGMVNLANVPLTKNKIMQKLLYNVIINIFVQCLLYVRTMLRPLNASDLIFTTIRHIGCCFHSPLTDEAEVQS